MGSASRFLFSFRRIHGYYTKNGTAKTRDAKDLMYGVQ
jgi:hypothetical protein